MKNSSGRQLIHSGGLWPSPLLGLGHGCAVLLLEPSHWDDFLVDAGWLAWQPCWLMRADGSYVHLQSQVVYESIDEFDQWCVVSVLGAAQVHLSWPCELGADQV